MGASAALRRCWPLALAAMVLAAAVLGYRGWRQRPVLVAVGVDMPLVNGAAIDPTDRYTADLYLEEHPRSRIRLVNMVNRPDPASGPATIAQLKREGVRLFITTQASNLAVPSLSQFKSGDALAINVSAVSPRLSGQDDYFFRLVPDVGQEQRALARQLSRRPGGRLLVLQDNGNLAYSEPAFAIVAAELQRSGRWRITRHKLDVAAFNPQRDRALMQGHFDGLYLLAGGFLPLLGNISQLFHQLHPEAPIWLTPWARSEAIVEHGGAASAHSWVLSPYPARGQDPAVARYFDRFRQRFGYTPYAMGIGTRQALELLDQALASGATTPAEVKRYMLSRPVHHTSLGPIRFDANGDVRAQFHLFPATADRQP
jgi:branched-chain amino acid transport system substrate-binding protein